MYLKMPRWSRCGAFIIDAVTINAFTTFFLQLLPNNGLFLTFNNFAFDIFNLLCIIVFQVLVASVYATVLYTYFGATFGKFFLRIDIVNEDNKKLTPLEIFKREQIKWTLIYGTVLIYPIYGVFCVLNRSTMLHEKITKTHIL